MNKEVWKLTKHMNKKDLLPKRKKQEQLNYHQKKTRTAQLPSEKNKNKKYNYSSVAKKVI